MFTPAFDICALIAPLRRWCVLVTREPHMEPCMISMYSYPAIMPESLFLVHNNALTRTKRLKGYGTRTTVKRTCRTP